MGKWLKKINWLVSFALFAGALELAWMVLPAEDKQAGVRACDEGENPYRSQERGPPGIPECRVSWLKRSHEFIELASLSVTALFTAFLGISTYFLWIATRDTARIAQRSLTDLERPYLFIVNLRPITADGGINAHQARALYDVANYGKTPAIIDKIEVGYFRTRDTVKGVNPAKADHPLFSAYAISPGQIIKGIELTSRPRIPLITLVDLKTETTFYLPQFSTTEELVVRVLIRYDGPASKGHETMSYWKWDDGSKSFVRHGGEAENYVK